MQFSVTPDVPAVEQLAREVLKLVLDIPHAVSLRLLVLLVLLGTGLATSMLVELTVNEDLLGP